MPLYSALPFRFMTRLLTAVIACEACNSFAACAPAEAQAAHIQGSDIRFICLCSFFLQLSLLDLKCSSQPSSLLAAACLANALEVYGKPVWPTVLQHYSAYNLEELHPMRLRLRAVRARSAQPLGAQAEFELQCIPLGMHGGARALHVSVGKSSGRMTAPEETC